MGDIFDQISAQPQNPTPSVGSGDVFDRISPTSINVNNIPPGHVAMTDSAGMLQAVPVKNAPERMKAGWKIGPPQQNPTPAPQSPSMLNRLQNVLFGPPPSQNSPSPTLDRLFGPPRSDAGIDPFLSSAIPAVKSAYSGIGHVLKVGGRTLAQMAANPSPVGVSQALGTEALTQMANGGVPNSREIVAQPFRELTGQGQPGESVTLGFTNQAAEQQPLLTRTANAMSSLMGGNPASARQHFARAADAQSRGDSQTANAENQQGVADLTAVPAATVGLGRVLGSGVVGNVASDVGDAASNAAKVTRIRVFPESTLTPAESLTRTLGGDYGRIGPKALKPGNSGNLLDLHSDIDAALPRVQQAALQSGTQISTLKDLIDSTIQAKSNLLAEHQSMLDPGQTLADMGPNQAAQLQSDWQSLDNLQSTAEDKFASEAARTAKQAQKLGGSTQAAATKLATAAGKYALSRAIGGVIPLGGPMTRAAIKVAGYSSGFGDIIDAFNELKGNASVGKIDGNIQRVFSSGAPNLNDIAAQRALQGSPQGPDPFAVQSPSQTPVDATVQQQFQSTEPPSTAGGNIQASPLGTPRPGSGRVPLWQQQLIDKLSAANPQFAARIQGPQSLADLAGQMPPDVMGTIGQDVGPTAGRSNPVANIRVTPGRFTSPIVGVPAPADPSLSIPQNWTFRNPNLNGEGALSDWLTSMPLDMLKAKAQARGIVFDGAQDPKTLTPNLVRQLVNDATPAEVSEAQAQAIERSRFPISRGGFTGGFQPPLPGGGAPPGAGPTDTASLLRQSLEARGIQVPPQLGGSGEIAEASNLNSPVQVKRFQEQAAQNVFGKPYDQLTVQQRVQLLPEATRLQSEARARVAAAPVPQPEQSIRPDLRAASIIQQAGMETLPGGGVSKELGTIIFNHPDYPGKPVIMSQDDVIKGGPEAVRAKMAARLAQPDIPRAGAPAPETPLQQGEPTSGTYGKEITVNTPSRTIPGQYKIVEADSLTPSHDPFTFAKNPEYPAGVQERAYDASQEAQNRVIQQAQDYRPNYTVNTNPDAVNGPPIVGPDGTVFGGNGRTMSTQRLYALGAGDSYRQFLSDNAAQFGVTPEQVSQFRNPVLVREIEAPDTVDAARRLGSDLNKNMTGALGVSEKSVSAGKNLRPQSLASIGSMLDDLGENASLRDLMRERGPDLLKILNKDGVITDRERPQFIDTSTGGLSEEGKTFVERALLGSVVDDPRLMDAAPKSVLNKLDRSLGDLASVGSRKDQYNVLPLLREAIADHAEAARSNMSAQQYLSQTAMFGPVRNPAVDALVLKLAEGPKAVTKAFRQFSQDASFDVPNQGMLGVTGKPSPAAAFNAAFGTNLTDEQFTDAFLQSLKKEGKIETGAGNEPSRQTVASQEAAPGVRPNPTAQTVTGSQGRAPAGNAGTQGPSGQGIIPPVSGNPQLDNLLKLLNARNKRP